MKKKINISGITNESLRNFRYQRKETYTPEELSSILEQYSQKVTADSTREIDAYVTEVAKEINKFQEDLGTKEKEIKELTEIKTKYEEQQPLLEKYKETQYKNLLKGKVVEGGELDVIKFIGDDIAKVIEEAPDKDEAVNSLVEDFLKERPFYAPKGVIEKESAATKTVNDTIEEESISENEFLVNPSGRPQ